METIFLDVGGHIGETLDEVLSSGYHFHRVYCFEPQKKCYDLLVVNYKSFVDSGKLIVRNYGLSNCNEDKPLYGDGIGASMFSDKVDIDNSDVEVSHFIAASDFLISELDKNNRIIMKLNCEGAEALILDDLIKTGYIHWLDSVRIDFNIRKIPSQRHKEKSIIADLENANFDSFSLVHNEAKCISHRDGIRLYLSQLKNAEDFMNINLFEKILKLLPVSLKRLVLRKRKNFYKRFGFIK